MKYRKNPEPVSCLMPEQYRVTQEDGTESPFTGEYVENKESGIYVDDLEDEGYGEYAHLLSQEEPAS